MYMYTRWWGVNVFLHLSDLNSLPCCNYVRTEIVEVSQAISKDDSLGCLLEQKHLVGCARNFKPVENTLCYFQTQLSQTIRTGQTGSFQSSDVYKGQIFGCSAFTEYEKCDIFFVSIWALLLYRKLPCVLLKHCWLIVLGNCDKQMNTNEVVSSRLPWQLRINL